MLSPVDVLTRAGGTLPAASDREVLSLFGDTGACVWAVDAEQRIVLWNEAAEQLLGISQDQAAGRPCYDVIAGRDRLERRVCRPDCSIMRRTRSGERVEPLRLLIRSNDGERIEVDVSVIPVRLEGTSKGLAALVHVCTCSRCGGTEAHGLHVRLLGAVEVQRPDGTLVDGPAWSRAKVRALFAYLALQRNCQVSRDALIEALWSDLDRESALHNLNTTVYSLRRSLEPSLRRGAESRFVLYSSGRYRLAGNPRVWLDVSQFELSVTRARRLDRVVESVSHYETALELYRGDLLADLGADHVWCAPERERLRQLYLSALEDLAAIHESDGRYDDASCLYMRALAADPCRESACRHLMELCLRRGDPAAAVAHYLRLAESQERELGLRPSPETRRLFDVARRSG